MKLQTVPDFSKQEIEGVANWIVHNELVAFPAFRLIYEKQGDEAAVMAAYQAGETFRRVLQAGRLRERQAESKDEKFPAGEYWIGDPCYAFDDDGQLYDQIIDNRFSANDHGMRSDLKFILGIFNTQVGDGMFFDDENRCYPIDSGTIACIEAWAVDAAAADRGPYHQFQKAVFCLLRRGNLPLFRRYGNHRYPLKGWTANNPVAPSRRSGVLFYPR